MYHIFIKQIDQMKKNGILAGKFPTLSWSGDGFTNWLTMNAVNINLGIASNALQLVGGLALTANPQTAIWGASSVASGAMGIVNEVAEVYQHSLIPPTAKGNTNGGDINTCSNCNTFIFYKMSIKQEYAKIIDDYFTMYGYKVNKLGIPNLRSRENWNYIETRNINITGNIPNDHLTKIKNIFDKGITLWHNDNVGNYNRTNNIR